ncbi:MAG: MerC family mercury resistance protein [Sphingopyxis sp.]
MCLPTPRLRRRSSVADLMGVGLSLTCLVHCLALPLLLLLAPALSHWIALPEGLHAAILLLALPAAAIAMRDGWRSHRRVAPFLMAVAGLALLAAGLAGHAGWLAVSDRDAADRWLTSAGALTLAAAHLVNWRWRHCQGT